jgi:hypothetical protein
MSLLEAVDDGCHVAVQEGIGVGARKSVVAPHREFAAGALPAWTTRTFRKPQSTDSP